MNNLKFQFINKIGVVKFMAVAFVAVMFAVLAGNSTAKAASVEPEFSPSNVQATLLENVTTPDRVAMFRLYNQYNSEHFYTASEGERDNLIEKGWKDEGIGWYAPVETSIPVYRLYNPYAGDHHYTTSEGEYDSLKKAGWEQEGIAWYSCEDDDVDKQPLYRQYNPYASTGTHNYSLSENERDYLVSLGWKDEGVGWYGYSRTGIDLSTAEVTLGDSLTYTGDEQTQTVTAVTLNGETLTADEDYNVLNCKQTLVGEYTLTIEGIKNYIGRKDVTFTIAKKPITVSELAFEERIYEEGNVDAEGIVSEAKFTDGDIAADDVVTLGAVTGKYADAEAGDNKVITCETLPQLEGADAANYELVALPEVMTGNVLAIVKIDTKTDVKVEDQYLHIGETAKAPQEVGQKEGLYRDSWHTDEKCTDDDEHIWVFNTSQVTSSVVTIYANWMPSYAEGLKYWIAPAMTFIDETTGEAKINEDYVREQWNVLKSSAEIQEDIQTIKQEEAEGILGQEGTVSKEYQDLMAGDKYHLYTAYNGNTNTYDTSKNGADVVGVPDDTANAEEEYAGQNSFLEARIIQVGSHDGDGTALTFQATHVLPQAVSVNSTATNVGGWGASNLCAILNSTELANPYDYVYFTGNANLKTSATYDGLLSSKGFNEGFINAVASIDKQYNVGGGSAEEMSTDVTTVNQKFWLLSYSEISATALEDAPTDEGTQYSWFGLHTINAGLDKDNKFLQLKTRNGKNPRCLSVSTENATNWMRSVRTNSSTVFMEVYNKGCVNDYSADPNANKCFGIAPAFALS